MRRRLMIHDYGLNCLAVRVEYRAHE